MKSVYAIFFLCLLHNMLYCQNTSKKIIINEDIELIKLSERVYVHVSWDSLPPFGRFSSNGLIFIEGKEAFLLDTPISEELTATLVNWLEDSLHITIKGFIPNHWHNDCIGGIDVLHTRGIVSYANQLTNEIARSKNLPNASHTFTDSLLLYLGGEVIELYYPGPAHTLDNIVVWFPGEQLLFAGCMVKSLNSSNAGNLADGNLKTYPYALRKLLSRYADARTVIPGHGAWGGVELITHTLHLVE